MQYSFITNQDKRYGLPIGNTPYNYDVTTSADFVENISNKKLATYIERKIFPYATEEDLCMDLIGKARQMAVNKFKDHLWDNMTDMEMLRSAGLYEKDMESGKEGFNMACILLFGKPETIQSCVPGYKTDAIYRVENLDRYDDRLIVYNNLLESYNLLIDFIKKHTDDKFFLIDGVNVSLRTAIAREIVSNLLVHREFKSAFPAKLIIEKDRIWTENWSRTQWKGRISLENFTPYPKNPIIAKFFVNIGYADSLGSGVRNLYKYTKIYSDAEPDFEENDVFRLSVPMRPAGATLTGDRKNNEVTKVTEKVTEVTDVTEKRIIELLKDNSRYKTTELAEMLDISRKTVSIKLKNLREKGIIDRVGSDRKGYWNIFL